MKKIPHELLALMADGQYHSGEKIGELLGVSRAAVWKQLQKLQALQLQFESVKGRGYRLKDRLDFLSQDAISACMQHKECRVEVHHQLDSTNAYLLRCLQQGGLARGHCVLAETQTSGRGRRGRPWLSPYGKNLYFSMHWQFEQGMASLDGLSLLVGLSVADALQSRANNTLQLKWPNDVLHDKRKLAGVLLEVTGDPTGLCHVVIGVGVNINWRPDTASGIDQPWTSLSQIGGDWHDRNLVMADILTQLLSRLPVFEREGFAPFVDDWQALDAFAGQEAVVRQGEACTFGIASGVTDKGELCLATDNGVQTFNGGEVSLRLTL